jgi:hypothetical protein
VKTATDGGKPMSPSRMWIAKILIVMGTLISSTAEARILAPAQASHQLP